MQAVHVFSKSVGAIASFTVGYFIEARGLVVCLPSIVRSIKVISPRSTLNLKAAVSRQGRLRNNPAPVNCSC